ncbi:MAG: serine/threonine-protein kinase [Pseudomonadota bacterium]
MTELQRGQILFDRYRIVDKVGQGGMAEIYSAVSTGAQGFTKLFAIKRILDSFALQPKFRDMFVAEARLAALLAHPNIVQTLEFVESDRSLYLIMEYVAGVNLSHAIRRCVEQASPLPLAVVIYIAVELLRGLDYAHRKTDSGGHPLRLVHRDVSPSNVLLSFEGFVKLSDFGIAKARFIPSLTQQGAIKGKVAYMAPEVVAGQTADARADVWGAGVVLWEMLANRRMLTGGDHEVVQALLQRRIPSLRTFRPDLPEGLHGILDASLACDPEQRFRSAGAMQHALTQTSHTLGFFLGAEGLQQRLQTLFPDALRYQQEVSNEFALVPNTLPTSPPLAVPAPVFLDDEPATVESRPATAVAAAPAAGPPTVETVIGTLEPPSRASEDDELPAAPTSADASTEDLFTDEALEGETRRLDPSQLGGRSRRRQSGGWRVLVFLVIALLVLAGGTILVEHFFVDHTPDASLSTAGIPTPGSAHTGDEPGAALPSSVDGSAPALDATRTVLTGAADAASRDIDSSAGVDAAASAQAPGASTRPSAGRLHITLQPAGIIFVDGEIVARDSAEAQVEVPAGAHEVKVRSPGIRRPARRRTQVRPGQVQRMDFDLRRGQNR